MTTSRVASLAALLTVLALAVGCGTSPGAVGEQDTGGQPVLRISAIPDQDPELLQRLYGTVSDYLSDALDVTVEYVPVTDYPAAVAAYRRGDLQLVFFGGLTGVQARVQVPGSIPVAQRDIDAEFRSVFIANAGVELPEITGVADLSALAGHTFTFGSVSSTSGRLMPQYFLSQAGVSMEDFASQPGFSDSHDATGALVEAGSYEVGVLNAAVWDARLAEGRLDPKKVKEIFRSPPYHDYHWLLRPDVAETFGAGFTGKVTDTLLAVDGDTEQEREILELFQAGRFIPTKPENYDQIEDVARSSGMLR